MYLLHPKVWRWACGKLFSLLALFVITTTSVWATSASLSTDTINISAGETGSFTISGNDDGSDNYQFRWDIPSGLNVTRGSSSNLNKFEIDWDKMRIKVESDARGSFSATINVSSNNNGSFVLNNTRAEINLNPSDITVNVGGTGGTASPPSGGGTTTPPPPDGGTATGNADYTFYIDSGQVDITASPDSGNGATSLPIWGYTDVDGGSGNVPGPIIDAVEGGTITVEVINNHDRNHNFVVQGLTSDTTAIPPGGESYIYIKHARFWCVYVSRHPGQQRKPISRFIRRSSGASLDGEHARMERWAVIRSGTTLGN